MLIVSDIVSLAVSVFFTVCFLVTVKLSDSYVFNRGQRHTTHLEKTLAMHNLVLYRTCTGQPAVWGFVSLCLTHCDRVFLFSEVHL